MLEKLFSDFCQDRLYLRNVSPLTIRSYRQAFGRFLKSGGSELSKGSLSAFVVKMRAMSLSPVSCNISIRAMNAFLVWLKENDHIPEPLKIAQLKVEKKIVKTYSDEELRILTWKPRSYAAQRLQTLIATLIDTGIRIDEALGIERSRVDFDLLTKPQIILLAELSELVEGRVRDWPAHLLDFIRFEFDWLGHFGER
jgi:integrase